MDTLAEAFAGSRELFEGLYLEQHWDWNRSYLVLRFDFSPGVLRSREELDQRITAQLDEQARRWNLTFESGTPMFLIELLRQKRFTIFDIDGYWASEDLLGAFDVDAIEPEALLFQTGYATIHERQRRPYGFRYRLGFPNEEVRISLPRAIKRNSKRRKRCSMRWSGMILIDCAPLSTLSSLRFPMTGIAIMAWLVMKAIGRHWSIACSPLWA